MHRFRSGCSAVACLFLVIHPGQTSAQSSDPLDTWSLRASGTTTPLNGVAFGNNTFVAVGNAGVVRTSTDGANWTAGSSGVSAALRGVTFFADRFFAVGGMYITGGYRDYVIASSNGINWSAVYVGTFASSAGQLNLNAITSGNGHLIAVGDSKYQAGPLAVESFDGVTWTEHFLASPPGYLAWDSLSSVTWGNGRFFAVGQYGMALYSDDGTNWLRAGGGSGVFNRSGVAYGAGSFTATGNNGSSGYVELMTTNGAAGGAGPYAGGLAGAGFGNGKFIVVGGTGFVATADSPAANWSLRPSITTNGLNAITYGNGTFVAVGARGTIIQSADVTRPWFKAISYDSTNGAKLTIRSALGATFALEQSIDLSNWFKVSDLTNATGELTAEDATAVGEAYRFYRTAP